MTGGISQAVDATLNITQTSTGNEYHSMSEMTNSNAGDIQNLKPVGENINLITESMGKLNDIMTKVISSFKIFNEQLEQRNQQNSSSTGSGANGTNDFFKKNPLASRGISAFTGALGLATSIDAGYEAYDRAYSTGDIMGAKANAWKSGGSVAQSLGGTLLSTGAMLSATPAGIPLMAVGGILEAGGAISNMVGNHKETDKTKAEVYESYLPSMSKFLATYGDSYLDARYLPDKPSVYSAITDADGNRIQAKTNNQLALDFVEALGKTDLVNTGLSTTDYLNYMSSLRKYGVTGYGEGDNKVSGYANASAMTSMAAKTSRAYGGDLSTELNFMGTVERYNGGGSGTTAFRKALDLNSLKIDKGQLDEILQGIQSSIEDGVSKGYTRNADEMVDTLAMLAQASGGSQFWTGKQGAARLQQMQSGIASMSNMDSTESMLVYRAFDSLGEDGIKKILAGKNADDSINTDNAINYLEGDSYLNTMAAIESGKVDKTTLTNVFDNLDKTYNGDRDSIVESLKKVFGLNTEGAIQLYNMRGNLNDTTLTDIMKNPELTDGETQKMNVLNNIKNETASIGSTLDEIWKGSEENGTVGLSTFVQGQTMNDVIAYWQDIANQPGMEQVNNTILPMLYMSKFNGKNTDVAVDMTKTFNNMSPIERLVMFRGTYGNNVYKYNNGNLDYNVFDNQQNIMQRLIGNGTYSTVSQLYDPILKLASKLNLVEQNKFIELYEGGKFTEELQDGILSDIEIEKIKSMITEAIKIGLSTDGVINLTYENHWEENQPQY